MIDVIFLGHCPIPMLYPSRKNHPFSFSQSLHFYHRLEDQEFSPTWIGSFVTLYLLVNRHLRIFAGRLTEMKWICDVYKITNRHQSPNQLPRNTRLFHIPWINMVTRRFPDFAYKAAQSQPRTISGIAPIRFIWWTENKIPLTKTLGQNPIKRPKAGSK